MKYIKEALSWLLCVMFILILNMFVLVNSVIPTGSMKNTLMPGTRVFGLRTSYSLGEAHRYDVAVFEYGYDCKGCGVTYRLSENKACKNCGRADELNSVVYYVKRVIGLPGDHIEIKRDNESCLGVLYINGEKQEEDYLAEPMICDGTALYPEVDITVPDESYYMLGDNRNFSCDARYWVENNFVHKDELVAKVYLKYWPLSEIGLVK